MRTCVVLVNYRGAEDTEFCLRSLRTSSVPVRVVVVDVTPFDQQLCAMLADYPEVELIRAESNLGFGRGNNLGMRWAFEHTACEFVFLLNNDASVLEDTIAHLQATLDAHPETGIVTPRIVYRSHPELLWYGGGEIDWRRASVFTPGFNGNAAAPEAMRARFVTFASGCAIMVQRQTLAELGGFDPRMFMYEEDVEWSMRAQERGCRIWYEPAAVVLHRAQGASRDTEEAGQRLDFWDTRNPRLDFYAFHILRNRALNVATHATGGQVAIASVGLALYMLRRALPFLRGGRKDAVWAMIRGVADARKSRSAVSVQYENDFSMFRIR